MPKKKGKFYIYILWITNSYNTLKSHKKHARTGLIILILKFQETSPGCLADLFISRLIYNIFLFNYCVFSFFSSVPYFVFCSSHAFLYFPLRKAASCCRYTYFHSGKLECYSNLGLNNSLSLFVSLSTY